MINRNTCLWRNRVNQQILEVPWLSILPFLIKKGDLLPLLTKFPTPSENFVLTLQNHHAPYRGQQSAPNMEIYRVHHSTVCWKNHLS
jgi:hypothetical protein